MLTAAEKRTFLEEIQRLKQELNAFQPGNSIKALERGENLLTLDQLSNCLKSEQDDNDVNLKKLLAERWDRIRTSGMSYTQQPLNKINQLCFKIAKALSEPYKHLIPTLKDYDKSINDLEMHEVVLSDKEDRLIPVAKCLSDAFTNEGPLRYMVDGGSYLELSESETERVARHTKQTTEYYDALVDRQVMHKLNELYKELKELVELQKGIIDENMDIDEPKKKEERVKDNFLKFVEKLSDRNPIRNHMHGNSNLIIDSLRHLRSSCFSPYKILKEGKSISLWGHMLDLLKPIHEKYYQEKQDTFKEKQAIFQEAMKKPDTLVFYENTELPPKHPIFTAFLQFVAIQPIEKQTDLLKVGCEAYFGTYPNVLFFALLHRQDLFGKLVEVVQTKTPQESQKILNSQYQDGTFLLTVAVKAEAAECLGQLLDSGQVEINHRNKQGENELDLAIAARVDALKLAKTEKEYASRLWARINYARRLGFSYIDGYIPYDGVIEEAQGHDLSFSEFSTKAKNNHDMVKRILRHVATLSAEKQKEYLSNVDDSAYPNVFFFIANHTYFPSEERSFTREERRSLFKEFITITLTQNKVDARKILNTRDFKYGKTPLMLAVELEDSESVNLLLSSGLVNINSESSHIRSTALHFAVKSINADIVRQLLGKGANISTRNDYYQLSNALDIAIEQYKAAHGYHIQREGEYETVRNILLEHLAKQPLNIQQDCLKKEKVPNVLLYKDADPALFEKLVDIVLEGKTESKAICDAQNEEGDSPLILAVRKNARGALEKLLNSGLVDISHRNKVGDNALDIAIKEADPELIQTFLKHLATQPKGICNVPNEEGNVPLIFAVRRGSKEVLEQLLNTGLVDVSCRNKAGNNALDIAIKQEDPELVMTILKHFATQPLDKQQECLSKIQVSTVPCPNVWFYAAMTNLDQLHELLRNSASGAALVEMKIAEPLYNIGQHCKKMVGKAQNNKNYHQAIDTATELLKTCTAEMDTFCKCPKDDNIQQKLNAFKSNCSAAIEKAKPVLDQHRDWAGLLAKLLAVILTLPISIPLLAFGVFSLKTTAAQVTNDLTESIEKSPAQKNPGE